MNKLFKKTLFILLFLFIFTLLLKCSLWILKIEINKSPNYYTIGQRKQKNYSKYSDFFNKATYLTPIPGLKEGAIPQSICYVKSKNLFVIAEYHIGKAPSVLQIVDEFGTYIKSVILKDTQGKNLNAHVGGITTNDATLWVSDEYKLYGYSLNEILEAPSMESVSATKDKELNLKADFISYYNDLLWIGEYEYKPFYNASKISKSMNTNALLIGYNVNDFSPEFAFTLPKKVQGIAWNNGNLIVSESFWFLEDSHIKEYEQVFETKIEKSIFIDNKEIPLRKLEDSHVIYEIVAPPMLEGIEFVHNKIYMLFESGANYYKYYTHYKVNGLYTISMSD